MSLIFSPVIDSSSSRTSVVFHTITRNSCLERNKTSQEYLLKKKTKNFDQNVPVSLIARRMQSVVSTDKKNQHTRKIQQTKKLSSKTEINFLGKTSTDPHRCSNLRHLIRFQPPTPNLIFVPLSLYNYVSEPLNHDVTECSKSCMTIQALALVNCL